MKNRFISLRLMTLLVIGTIVSSNAATRVTWDTESFGIDGTCGTYLVIVGFTGDYSLGYDYAWYVSPGSGYGGSLVGSGHSTADRQQLNGSAVSLGGYIMLDLWDYYGNEMEIYFNIQTPPAHTPSYCTEVRQITKYYPGPTTSTNIFDL